LQDTLRRAQSFTSDSRICSVVAADHEAWWREQLTSLSRDNIIVEPVSRGTAIGILSSALRISAKDPDALIVLLPCDHFVADETVLAHAFRQALIHVRSHKQEVVLLGMEPAAADPELGYILPGESDSHGVCRIARFVEKPSLREANRLIDSGALLNTFIIVASANALVCLYAAHFRETVVDVQSALRSDSLGTTELAALYGRLPFLDFSQQIIESSDYDSLRVIAVPPCGWIDLGTPQHLAEALQKLSYSPLKIRTLSTTHINLAEQYELSRQLKPSSQNRTPQPMSHGN
jgi:mannose-1-phosphate guanylyltransferase